jgi:hypothetical protein
VLRLWVDQLLIRLSPDTLSIRHLGGMPFARKCIAQVEIEVGRQNELSWSAGLAGLEHWLQQSVFRQGNCKVVLSDDFVRYSLLPACDEPLTKDELRRFAFQHFERVFGNVVQSWAVTHDRPSFGSKTPAAAMDKALLDGLERIIGQSGTRIVSVQPQLTVNFNYWKKRLKGKRLLFVSADKAKVTLLRIHDGNWASLRQEAISNLNLATLRVVLERDRLANVADSEDLTIYLFAPAMKDGLQELSHAGWRIERLQHIPSPGKSSNGSPDMAAWVV